VMSAAAVPYRVARVAYHSAASRNVGIVRP
jgi:hypothetical protein